MHQASLSSVLSLNLNQKINQKAYEQFVNILKKIAIESYLDDQNGLSHKVCLRIVGGV